MNKKQKEAKRKNAQAHQKKVKDLVVQRLQKRAECGERLITRELFKPSLAIAEIPTLTVDPLSDVFGEFFAKQLEYGAGFPTTPGLGNLIQMANSFPIVGRKCK